MSKRFIIIEKFENYERQDIFNTSYEFVNIVEEHLKKGDEFLCILPGNDKELYNQLFNLCQKYKTIYRGREYTKTKQAADGVIDGIGLGLTGIGTLSFGCTLITTAHDFVEKYGIELILLW